MLKIILEILIVLILSFILLFIYCALKVASMSDRDDLH